MLETLHFLRPLWFLAMLPLPWMLWRLSHVTRQQQVWQQACDPHLLPHLLVAFPVRRQFWPLLILALCWLLVITALAGPVWTKHPAPVFKPQQARVLVLDLSRSMDATDLKPSRLERARFKLLDILARAHEGQSALLVFAGDVHVVTPLTTDAETIAALVPTLTTDLMPIPGSATAAALRMAAEVLAQGGASQGRIILLSDDDDSAAALDQAAALKARGYQLDVIGLGTTDGAPIPVDGGGYFKDSSGAIVMPRLDTNGLQALAEAGGGVYLPLATDNRDVNIVLRNDNFSEAVDQRVDQHNDTWREEGPWLLLLVLPLVALTFRRGVLLSLLLAPWLLGSPAPVQALEWQDLWVRPDQQGSQALTAEKPAEAAQLFDDPAWRGSAHYRAGEYEKAAEAFSHLDSADAHFNRGNALAKQGNIAAALEAYQTALAKQPDLADAQANLALLEQLQQQQNQAQPDQQNQQDDKDSAQQSGDQQDKQASQDGDSQSSPQQSDSGQQSEPQEGQQDNASEGQQDAASQDAQQAGEPAQQNGESTPSQQPDQAEQTDGEQANQDAAAVQQAADEQAQQNAEQPQAASEQATAPEANPADPAEQADQTATAEPPPATSTDTANADRPTMSSMPDAEAQPAKSEEELAMEQYLRRVPDDPGGLLRNKFYVEHLKQRTQQAPASGKTW